MTRAQTLTFSDFTTDNKTFTFTYVIDGTEYTVRLGHSHTPKLSSTSQETVIFNLGMCYLIDLAEMVVPEKITINFKLSPLQLEFWRTLYQEVAKEKMFKYKLDLVWLEAEWSGHGSPSV